MLATAVAAGALICVFAVVWGTVLYIEGDLHAAYAAWLTWLAALTLATGAYTLWVAASYALQRPGRWRLARWAALTWGAAFLWGCATVWFAFALVAFTIATAVLIVPVLLLVRVATLVGRRLQTR